MNLQQAPRHLVVFSGKGGVGKSTLSAALAQISGSTLIDCDPQLTSTDWGDRRSGEPSVISAQLGRIPTLLQQHERTVTDTPGALIGNILTALQSADLILLVTNDHQPELDALPSSIELAQASGTPVAVVINKVHPFTDAAPLREFIGSMGVSVSPVVIRERSQHYKAWAEGLTAVEYAPESPAADEIRALWTWLEQTHG